METREFIPVCIGASAGGIEAISSLLTNVGNLQNLSFLMVQHIRPDAEFTFINYLNERLPITVKEAIDKELIKPGHAYYAPPNYHIMVDEGPCLTLSVDKPVNYCRPSIDVLFQSAAELFRKKLLPIKFTVFR